MEANQLSGLRQVNREELMRHYREASTAALHAKFDDSDIERWPAAARALCGLLSFIQGEQVLWSGLHEGIGAAEGSLQDLQVTRNQLSEFIDAEFELLVLAGVDKDTAGRIVFDIKVRLQSQVNPTHDDIEAMRGDIATIHDYLCTRDFAIYAQPEREARNNVNTNAILAGGGGLVGTVCNAFIPLFPPFVAGSVVGGIAAAIGGFRAFQRRKRG